MQKRACYRGKRTSRPIIDASITIHSPTREAQSNSSAWRAARSIVGSLDLEAGETQARPSTTAELPIMIVASADLSLAQRARRAGAAAILVKGDLDRQAMAVALAAIGIRRKEGRT